MSLVETNLKKLEDFKNLQAKGRSYLHIITLSCAYTYPKLNVGTISRIRQWNDSVCSNFKNDEKVKQILEKLPIPYDIWVWKSSKKIPYTSWFGKNKIKEESFYSYYFIFDRKLTEEEVAYWNFFIVGRYS